MATAPFVCSKCGAALAIPPNPMLVSARCGYCGTETVLPAHLIAARQPPMPYAQQPYAQMPIQPITAVTPLTGPDANRRMRLTLWIVGLSVALPLILTGVIMWFVHSVLSDVGVLRHR